MATARQGVRMVMATTKAQGRMTMATVTNLPTDTGMGMGMATPQNQTISTLLLATSKSMALRLSFTVEENHFIHSSCLA